jgi:hypothetical protein
MELVEGKYLEYKDRPLVREGNTICYGDKAEKCFLLLEIMSTKQDELSGEELPNKILIQIIDSKDSTKILKQGDKNGLYDAFSIGLVWLERALA